MPAATHAAFLRAVNLGGRRRASREELRSTFEQLGFTGVESFRASGNVVFAAPPAAEATLRVTIERGLAEQLGFAVSVYVRSAAELLALVRARPFGEGPASQPMKAQVAFLNKRPPPRLRQRVLAYATAEDLLSFGSRELVWLSSGTGRRTINLRAIEQLVGPWTMRTIETVEQVAARCRPG